jgi:hypothetical protein
MCCRACLAWQYVATSMFRRLPPVAAARAAVAYVTSIALSAGVIDY